MFALCTPLLPRLRRHPLLWVLVAVVLLTKLVSSSVCAADLRVADLATAPGVTTMAPIATTGDSGCLLGETACHCACAETLPIPMAAFPPIPAAPPVSALPRLAAAVVPAALDSPLRPPIA